MEKGGYQTRGVHAMTNRDVCPAHARAIPKDLARSSLRLQNCFGLITPACAGQIPERNYSKTPDHPRKMRGKE
jgi:hypothetical protein